MGILDKLFSLDKQRKVKGVEVEEEFLHIEPELDFQRFTSGPDCLLAELEDNIVGAILSEGLKDKVSSSVDLTVEDLKRFIKEEQVEENLKTVIRDYLRESHGGVVLPKVLRDLSEAQIEEIADCVQRNHIDKFIQNMEFMVHQAKRFPGGIPDYLFKESTNWDFIRQNIIYDRIANKPSIHSNGPIDNILKFLAKAVKQGDIQDPLKALNEQMPQLFKKQSDQERKKEEQSRFRSSQTTIARAFAPR